VKRPFESIRPLGPVVESSGDDTPVQSAKTRLKYDVTVEVSQDIFEQNPKATELIDMRISSVQMSSNDYIRKTIGDIILAVNRLDTPSTIRVVNKEIQGPEDSNLVSPGTVRIIWTYVIDGSGIGEVSNTQTRATYMKDLYEVLVEENDDPIKNSAKQREWNPEPYEVQGIKIATE